MPEPALRLALMTAGPEVEAPFAAAVIELVGTEGVELALWIDEGAGHPPAEPVDLSALLDVAPRVSAGDAEAIAAANLDVVLRRDAAWVWVPARHGVWAFHGTGVREVAAGEAAAETRLVRVANHPGEGVVLQRCVIAAQRSSASETRDRLAWAGTHMPARVARDLRNGVAAYLDGPAELLPLDAAPAPRLWWRTRIWWVRGQLQSLLRLERWHVGVVRQPIERFLEPGFAPEIEWLPNRRSWGFLADPFLAADRILMEEWDDAERRGWISEVELEAGLRGAPLRVAFDTGKHLAYPYTFEHEGRILCAPENHERDGVFLYALGDDGHWREHARLLDGVAAVDPTIVFHDGRWWLFATDYDAGPEDKLFLWSAPELLGPWTPHPGNPVKVDVRSSRPAGTPFVVDGVLYRPAQDSAVTYGNAVVVNRVTRLTETEFAEEPVVRHGPRRGTPQHDGFHTIAGQGGLTAVDGKRLVLAPRLVAPRLAGKARRLYRAVRRSSSAS